MAQSPRVLKRMDLHDEAGTATSWPVHKQDLDCNSSKTPSNCFISTVNRVKRHLIVLNILFNYIFNGRRNCENIKLRSH